MNEMKTKTMSTKRSRSQGVAANAVWKRIVALADKLSHCLRFDWNESRIQDYSSRLAEMIGLADRDNESVIGQGCRSLIAEAEGNIPLAIKHRKKEMDMIRELHEAVRGTSYEEVAIRGLGPKKLQETMLALSRLYLDNGQVSQAIETLEKARSFSQEKGIALDEHRQDRQRPRRS
jgi:hypothetical protein